MMPRYYLTLRNDLYCIVDRETNATVRSYESFLVASRIRDEMNGGEVNATILTATVSVGTKDVPLSKAIIEQVPVAEWQFVDNHRFQGVNPECSVLGEVQIDNGKNEARNYWLIINTPRGLRKLDTHYKAALLKTMRESDSQAHIERIILLK